MHTKHILLKTPLLVHPIMKSLEQGVDFSQLAREHSACPSAESGGTLGNLTLEDFPKSVQEALQGHSQQPLSQQSELPSNPENVHPIMDSIVGPIESHHGLHIFKLD